jgi:methylenetetrahydrofolate reductase (NADPH)
VWLVIQKTFEPHHYFDLKRLKEKVDAGAGLCGYSNVLDNAKYFEFVDKARAMGITVLLFWNKTHCRCKGTTTRYCQIFRIDLPEDLIQAVDGCKIMRLDK